MDKKTYSILDMDELERLSIVGGIDTENETTQAADYITIDVTNLVTTITIVSVALSTLFSCTRNTIVCKRV